jgi:hypothetical protein
MGYEHRTVESMTRTTAQAKEFAASAALHRSATDTFHYAQVERVIDGIPMCKQLADLCDSIRAKYKNIQFAVAYNATVTIGYVTTVATVWAYFDGDTYALMELSYIPQAGYRDGESRYGVYARHISNERFSGHNAEYHRCTSTREDKALAAAKKYMRPYAAYEIAERSYSKFRDLVVSSKSAVSVAPQDAMRKVTMHPQFISEMENLAQSEYAFRTPEIKEHILAFLVARAEHAEVVGKRRSAAYVYVRMDGGDQVFDVYKVTNDITNTWSNPIYAAAVPTTFKTEELPEYIYEKLGVLSILTIGGYVADIGMKYSDNVYWICL